MDPSEKDETPMLATTFVQSDYGSDSTVRHFSTRMRSASMSIPSNYMDSSEDVNRLVGFTGPLRNERRNIAVQMTGPLYANRNHEVVFQPPQSALLQQNTESKVERYPSSIDGMANIHWPSDDYGGKNEHLFKSGQLGMCNDPYCTTCPTYYNAKGRQKHSRTSEIFDAKVLTLCQLFSL